MDRDNKFWSIFWGIMWVVFCLTVWAVLYWDYKKEVRMAELSYQKTMLAGSSISYYQKVPEGGK